MTLNVSVAEAEGHCPKQTFDFTADLFLPGEPGPITYRWEGPNEYNRNDGTVMLTQGRPDKAVRYVFLVNGGGNLSGDVVLHLLTPLDRRSAPVHIAYRCP